jgi:hypothetical protein
MTYLEKVAVLSQLSWLRGYRTKNVRQLMVHRSGDMRFMWAGSPAYNQKPRWGSCRILSHTWDVMALEVNSRPQLEDALRGLHMFFTQLEPDGVSFFSLPLVIRP